MAVTHPQSGRTVGRDLGRSVLGAVAVGLVYALAAESVFFLITPGRPAYWAGAGVGLGALLITPRRRWPLVLAAVAVAELVVNAANDVTAVDTALSVVGNVGEQLLVASLIVARCGPRPSFDDRRRLLVLLGAVAVGTVFGAALQAVNAALHDRPAWTAGLRWWQGDSLGMLVVAPALAALPAALRLPRRRQAELGALVAAVGLLAVLAFTWSVALMVFVVSAMVVAAFRLEAVGAGATVLVGAAVAERLTAYGHGPLAAAVGPRDSLTVLQVSIVGVAMTTLLIAGEAAEVRRRGEAERRAEAARRRLVEQVADAEEAERRRLADELHDGPVQDLAALAVRLEMLRDGLADSGLTTALGGVEDQVRASIRELRTLMFRLEPPDLEEQGLAGAIGGRAEATLGDVDVEVSVTDELFGAPSRPLSVAAYRIALEAVINVRKHAKASRVEILLRRDGGELLLMVDDDGRGLPLIAPAPTPGHRGVQAMRDRADDVGGVCRLEPSPPGGARVLARLPWAAAGS
ncbi:MAG: MASE1 domain-containing protein [Acidimicrobiales bacterium]